MATIKLSGGRQLDLVAKSWGIQLTLWLENAWEIIARREYKFEENPSFETTVEAVHSLVEEMSEICESSDYARQIIGAVKTRVEIGA